MLLEGKVALVTGATRGIGLATVNRFCEEGAKVFLNGRDEAKLLEIVTSLTDQGFDVEPLVFDVSKPDQVKDAFRALVKKTKKLDILVNNAGILDDALIGMVSVEQVQRTFEINTFSSIYVSQYASRLMQRNGTGSIINLASIIGTNGNSGQAVYGGSKAAVIGITKSLAKELAQTNIRVNAIAPGFIKTDMACSIPEDKFQERMESIAMKRIGEPEDIANTAVYLGSDLSSYVTGQVIGVDGGMLI